MQKSHLVEHEKRGLKTLINEVQRTINKFHVRLVQDERIKLSTKNK